MSTIKGVFRITGLPRIAQLYPNLYERTMYKIASGSAFPRWWDAWRYNPPKENHKLERIHRIKVPLDTVIKDVLQRIPMLRKEELNYNDPDFSPLCARIASVWNRLQKQEGLDKEEAFKKCEEEIFAKELYAFARTVRTSKGSYFGLTHDESTLFRLHDIINDMYGETRPSTSSEAAALASNYIARRDAHINHSPDPKYMFATEEYPSDGLNVNATFYVRTRKYAPQVDSKVPMASDLPHYKKDGHAGLPDHIPVTDYSHGEDMDSKVALRFDRPVLEMDRYKRAADPIDQNAFFTRIYGNLVKAPIVQKSTLDQRRHLPPSIPEGKSEFSLDYLKLKKYYHGIENLSERRKNIEILQFIDSTRANQKRMDKLRDNMKNNLPHSVSRPDWSELRKSSKPIY